uniref:Uncharacterized protein AlNc14C86G5488 n=1 Tax=Albugo laibachii Nc14 TaxID=890382 RepID=F0WFV3_9STRA|nr:conserved hypothetical protein [Albugo laibachii Nc14]|eukprot:CCA20087.1 conserved hypothetical protein [Albugo laibachii Nc14]
MCASNASPISLYRSHSPIYRPASKTKGNASTQSTPIQTAPKDLILCNHTNFFEILYLAKRFSPHFVIPIYDAKKESQSEPLVKGYNLIQAIYQSLRIPLNCQRKASKSHTLTQILQKTSKPIVLFPEGARSNGQSVLTFLPVLKEPTRVHLMSFRYDYHYLSPSFSAGSAWKYLIKVSFAVYHQLHVTYLNADHLSHIKHQADAGLQQYRKLVASMLRTKGVDLNVEDFCSFNAYWNHISRGGKSSAATFTSRKAPHEHARWNES